MRRLLLQMVAQLKYRELTFEIVKELVDDIVTVSEKSWK